ncbi:hypothetical protein ACET3Z_021872 [Daucus carota]
MAMSTIFSSSPNPPTKPTFLDKKPIFFNDPLSRRSLLLTSFSSISFLSLSLNPSLFIPSLAQAQTSSPPKSFLSGIANTKSWFQFYGDGFTIRVPPDFKDFTEPEDYSAGLSLYGDKAKPKVYAARFASPDGSEVVSVVLRTSNSLKITFLEAKDITDIGSLKDAAKLFVPGGATLYSARTIKIKEDEGFRNYYYYEFGREGEHFAVVTAVNRGKVFIAGAAAPQSKWEDDGMKLRSAAISLSIL